MTMPPKKRKQTSIVVGTVSTRSTRRESIVNIQIKRKSGKGTKSQTDNAENANITPQVKVGTSSEVQDLQESSSPSKVQISELLKDWSDEENTEDVDIFPPSNSVRSDAAHSVESHIEIVASVDVSQSVTDDQQSLIDILEGKIDKDDGPETRTDRKNPASMCIKKLQIEDSVITVESPKVEDMDVIEECVIEDNSIIIDNLDDNNSINSSTSLSKFNKTGTGQTEKLDNISYKEIDLLESEDLGKNDNISHISKSVQIRESSNEAKDDEETFLCEKLSDSVNVCEYSQKQHCDLEPHRLQMEISKMSLDNEMTNIERRPSVTETINLIERDWSDSVGDQSPVNDDSLESSANIQIKEEIMDIVRDEIQLEPELNVIKEGPETGSIGDTSKSPQKRKHVLKKKIKQPELGKRRILAERRKKEKYDKEVELATKLYTEYVNDRENSIKLMRSKIDATIDDVLRKYTCNGDTEINASPPEDPKQTKSPKEQKDPKKRKEPKSKKEDNNGEGSEEVRRSDRIKTIAPVQKKSRGLVKAKSEPNISLETESSDSNSLPIESDKSTPISSPKLSKNDKSKTKAKSSENVSLVGTLSPSDSTLNLPKPVDLKAEKSGQGEIEARLKTFVHLKENQYKTDRQVSKEAKGILCDCYLAEEDVQNGEFGCGEDCLNRLLLIECGEQCQVGARCTNKKFQKGLFAPVEVFKTEKKGLGLRAAANIAYGEFILEYVGEVLDPDEFDKRAEVYSNDKNMHFYFMSLRTDAIIDATMKGNISRFINHSCDPNAETQKWTVNGELRIGFFSTRTILAGEEITFDYRFQRYGKEAQKCFCEAEICRGWLGERPGDSEEEEEDDEEETVAQETAESAKPKNEVVEQFDSDSQLIQENKIEEIVAEVPIPTPENVIATPEETLEKQDSPKKITRKKPRKEILYEDFDQLNDDIEMLLTTGLKNQAHTLKLSRLMVRAKELEQRKKLLHVLRRGELPCRRLFLDYHGLRLIHGYMIDAQQLSMNHKAEALQTKLELLQTLAVLPIQSKTILIESKVLPAVEKWARNEDILEDSDAREAKRDSTTSSDGRVEPREQEKIEEIKFLASKLLEEWINLKESFKIPKRQRIEQMKEHEKEANRKFLESSYAQEKDSSRKNEPRNRSWARYKSEKESSGRKSRFDDKDRPSAEFLKISKHERRKLFALQMELREEERRLKQRELWRQHEMNCLLIGTDPRFTAPFDPTKGFQYIWNPALGRWQALPVPQMQNQAAYTSTATAQGVGPNYGTNHKPGMISPYPGPIMNVPGIPAGPQAYPGLQPTLPPMVPGLPPTTLAYPGLPGMPQTTIYQEIKQEDPSQVKFAGPIPPPVKLPPKWKCAKDKYGRPFYYHVKIRKSQWEPPPHPDPAVESSESSSTESSTASSSETSSDSDSNDDIDDAQLMLEVRKHVNHSSKTIQKCAIPEHIKKEVDVETPSPEMENDSNHETDAQLQTETGDKTTELSSIDIRLKEQFNLESNESVRKKKRAGLCQEIIISPRTEEDRKQFKEDVKRYKATKEKLKRQKEQMLLQSKRLKLSSADEDPKRVKEKHPKLKGRSHIKEKKEWNDENAKKIKETFRSTMATTVVSVLNAYRKPDCKEGKITNTDDFKHLARKLTHFVMLKEMKHLSSIEDLVCTDSVRAKAREYIKKYMGKFGEVYQKRQDEPDFKD